MRPILIAGGGIGGLTLAIALARRGIGSTVFEAREVPPAEGAGIQLGPNATRLLAELELDQALAAEAVAPDCIIVNDGRSGRELTRLPLGTWIEARHGAPYWVVHRAALHQVLWQRARALPLIELVTGSAVTAVHDADQEDKVVVRLADGGTADGRLLVGADGLWSRVRADVEPTFELTYTGMTAARAIVPRAEAGARFQETATGVFLAPDAHVVHYPIDGGAAIAIVAIAAAEVAPESWTEAICADVVSARLTQLVADVRALVDGARGWRQWPLMQARGLTRWSKGRVVLIGDAAHPILPYLAQGGAMAIEDACLLARLIDAQTFGRGDDMVATGAEFARLREPRARRIQNASAENGRAYHAAGALAGARNLALSSLPGHLIMRRYDWIYGART